ncbi:MAG: hypothetical protein KGJ02_05055 [Verrucomicrobiota bacterium]|nr:hypothetical protein [Verrucomicrobiota bacterium]
MVQQVDENFPSRPLEEKVAKILRFTQFIEDSEGNVGFSLLKLINTKSDAAVISRLASYAAKGDVRNMTQMLQDRFQSPRTEFVQKALTISMKEALSHDQFQSFDALLSSSALQSLQDWSEKQEEPKSMRYSRYPRATPAGITNAHINEAQMAVKELFYAVSGVCMKKDPKYLEALCVKADRAGKRAFQDLYFGQRCFKEALGTPYFEAFSSLVEKTVPFTRVGGYNLEKFRTLHEEKLRPTAPVVEEIEGTLASLSLAEPVPMPASSSPQIPLASLEERKSATPSPRMEESSALMRSLSEEELKALLENAQEDEGLRDADAHLQRAHSAPVPEAPSVEPMLRANSAPLEQRNPSSSPLAQIFSWIDPGALVRGPTSPL